MSPAGLQGSKTFGCWTTSVSDAVRRMIIECIYNEIDRRNRRQMKKFNDTDYRPPSGLLKVRSLQLETQAKTFWSLLLPDIVHRKYAPRLSQTVLVNLDNVRLQCCVFTGKQHGVRTKWTINFRLLPSRRKGAKGLLRLPPLAAGRQVNFRRIDFMTARRSRPLR